MNKATLSSIAPSEIQSHPAAAKDLRAPRESVVKRRVLFRGLGVMNARMPVTALLTMNGHQAASEEDKKSGITKGYARRQSKEFFEILLALAVAADAARRELERSRLRRK